MTMGKTPDSTKYLKFLRALSPASWLDSFSISPILSLSSCWLLYGSAKSASLEHKSLIVSPDSIRISACLFKLKSWLLLLFNKVLRPTPGNPFIAIDLGGGVPSIGLIISSSFSWSRDLPTKFDICCSYAWWSRKYWISLAIIDGEFSLLIKALFNQSGISSRLHSLSMI